MGLNDVPRYDVATALGLGQRELQEDALVTDFPAGQDVGFVVLADGMGGHAAGELASAILVTEVFAELKFKLAELKTKLEVTRAFVDACVAKLIDGTLTAAASSAAAKQASRSETSKTSG